MLCVYGMKCIVSKMTIWGVCLFEERQSGSICCLKVFSSLHHDGLKISLHCSNDLVWFAKSLTLSSGCCRMEELFELSKSQC